jgi:hypothetical protein
MILIEGLTPKQKLLLDVMWAMETKQQVETFIKSLPPKDSTDATNLLEILIHESLEAQGELDQYENYAKAAISRARLS